MTTQDDRQLAKQTVELGFASKQDVAESLRILRLRGDIEQPISLDKLLFERGLLSADEVYEVQARSGLRPAFCPACPARLNTFLSKPGSVTACPRCGHRIPVAGYDPRNPFKTRSLSRRLSAPPSGKEQLVGLLGVAGCATLLGKSVQESWSTHMGLPALASLAAFAGLVVLLGRRRRFLAAASLGLAIFTGLIVGSALGNPPGAPALRLFGLDAHRVLPPLILLHLVLLILVASSALVRRGSTVLLLGMLVPALYGLAFFTWRCAPSTDPSLYLSGGPKLLPSRLPWFLHPGAVTLLALFPLAALAFLFTGALELRMTRLVRHVGLAAGLALLSGLGLAIGTARGTIPSARLEHEVQRALDGRLASFWTHDLPHPGAPLHMSTAAALSEGTAPVQTSSQAVRH